MMAGLAIELFGGPLDGLQLAIPEAVPVLRFPMLNGTLAWHAPLLPDAPVKTEELEYVRSVDKPGHYVWKYT